MPCMFSASYQRYSGAEGVSNDEDAETLGRGDREKRHANVMGPIRQLNVRTIVTLMTKLPLLDRFDGVDEH
jgi:hypothetical protein